MLHLDETPTKQGKPFSLKDILNDAFLYAVPKHRRSLEKRQKRRFGLPEYNWKMLSPKTNIRTCNVCGDDHEAGKLCRKFTFLYTKRIKLNNKLLFVQLLVIAKS